MSESLHWRCISGCGSCCRLDPGERNESLDALSPEQQQQSLPMVGPDGRFIHPDPGSTRCRTHSARPLLSRLGHPAAPVGGAGQNCDLSPTSFEAEVLKRVVDFKFEPFSPDIPITNSLDLSPWGVAGKAVVMPGHTPGSLVIKLNDREVFVGDMMRGGSMGGAVNPTQPHVHYFQADLERNRANIRSLVEDGAEVFYLGHGGPVNRAAVIKEFKMR